MNHSSFSDFSLYIHIPFCRRKCLYCDFFSGGLSIADFEAYINAAISELSFRLPHFLDEMSSSEAQPRLVSIYFGGGTPSCLPPHLFRHMSETIFNILGECALDSNCEITIEVNPDDVNIDNILAWKDSGVNRVSIGIQSLDDEILKKIGRLHSASSAIKAVNLLKEHFSNISCDLIFGIPGQSLFTLKQDVNKIISLQPSHISLYSLMYEEGTALTALRDAGRILPVDDDISVEMYSFLSDSLSHAGYEQYEISNYSRPGYQSLHNSGYWFGRPYLGLGPSAHSFNGDSVRTSNPADIKGYTAFYNSDKSRLYIPDHQFFNAEHLSKLEKMEEMIMLRLRTARGISLSNYENRFGTRQLHSLLYKADSFLESAHLVITDNFLRLTSEGIMICDTIISSLLPDS